MAPFRNWLVLSDESDGALGLGRRAGPTNSDMEDGRKRIVKRLGAPRLRFLFTADHFKVHLDAPTTASTTFELTWKRGSHRIRLGAPHAVDGSLRWAAPASLVATLYARGHGVQANAPLDCMPKPCTLSLKVIDAGGGAVRKFVAEFDLADCARAVSTPPRELNLVLDKGGGRVSLRIASRWLQDRPSNGPGGTTSARLPPLPPSATMDREVGGGEDEDEDDDDGGGSVAGSVASEPLSSMSAASSAGQTASDWTTDASSVLGGAGDDRGVGPGVPGPGGLPLPLAWPQGPAPPAEAALLQCPAGDFELVLSQRIAVPLDFARSVIEQLDTGRGAWGRRCSTRLGTSAFRVGSWSQAPGPAPQPRSRDVFLRMKLPPKPLLPSVTAVTGVQSIFMAEPSQGSTICFDRTAQSHDLPQGKHAVLEERWTFSAAPGLETDEDGAAAIDVHVWSALRQTRRFPGAEAVKRQVIKRSGKLARVVLEELQHAFAGTATTTSASSTDPVADGVGDGVEVTALREQLDAAEVAVAEAQAEARRAMARAKYLKLVLTSSAVRAAEVMAELEEAVASEKRERAVMEERLSCAFSDALKALAEDLELSEHQSDTLSAEYLKAKGGVVGRALQRRRGPAAGAVVGRGGGLQ